MEWAASFLHTTSEHGVSSITSADAHTSAASCRRPRRFKCTRPFRRKTKSGSWTFAITFQTQSTAPVTLTSALDKGGWSTSFPGRFTSGKELRCPVWPSKEKRKISCPQRGSNPGLSRDKVNRYTDYAICNPYCYTGISQITT
jgi:hypothetical protein